MGVESPGHPRMQIRNGASEARSHGPPPSSSFLLMQRSRELGLSPGGMSQVCRISGI